MIGGQPLLTAGRWAIARCSRRQTKWAGSCDMQEYSLSIEVQCSCVFGQNLGSHLHVLSLVVASPNSQHWLLLIMLFNTFSICNVLLLWLYLHILSSCKIIVNMTALLHGVSTDLPSTFRGLSFFRTDHWFSFNISVQFTWHFENCLTFS